jgi:hypothetical protein
MELFKYATLEFKTRLLTIFNRILNGERPPEIWNKAIAIPSYKKGAIITRKITEALDY